MSPLISPDQLAIDAVVPQCLDNQYLPEDVFRDMIKREVGYEDSEVAAARDRAFRTEFARSLVYSSQVVIQRAYLKNSDFLTKWYQPLHSDRFTAFAQLIRDSAVVPFLFRENSLTDELEFDVRKPGDAAVKALVEALGDDVRCVRLALNDAANATAAAHMETEFASGVARVNFLNEGQRNGAASELFLDPGPLQEPGGWEAFGGALDRLGDYAHDKARAKLRETNKPLDRTDVYRDQFAAGEDDKQRAGNVVDGYFRAPRGADRFLLALKKYVDLVYNCNLPDHLARYTFTPTNMPSRLALQDMPTSPVGHDKLIDSISNRDALEQIRRTFQARTQAAMTLPLLSELTPMDIVEVRALPEWDAFNEAQSLILSDPLRCLVQLPHFEEAFDQFQRALSRWYNLKYKREQTVAHYGNLVTLAISVGGTLLIAGAHLATGVHDAADLVIPTLASRLPKKVRGYVVKLMVLSMTSGTGGLIASEAIRLNCCEPTTSSCRTISAS